MLKNDNCGHSKQANKCHAAAAAKEILTEERLVAYPASKLERLFVKIICLV